MVATLTLFGGTFFSLGIQTALESDISKSECMLAALQWLLLQCGVVSIVISLVLFLCLPDKPTLEK